ncbi:MAG: hypothetical protein R3236_07215 [Phycisphaeraceae bacterium]|nr:hypothetical protein [Phycisphaeraceae bacterium]
MSSAPTISLWVLRIALAAQCLGAAAYCLKSGSTFHSVLFQIADPKDQVGPYLDYLLAALLLLSAAVVLIRPWKPVLGFLAALFFLDACCATWLDGSFMSEWSLASRATRFATPLALYWLLLKPDQEKGKPNFKAAEWAMRIGSAAVFAAHGYKALNKSPGFIDLLIASANNLLGWPMSQETAEGLLLAIGAIDLVVAALVLGMRWSLVAGYMALWASVAALSRMTAFGPDWWHQTVLRAANGGLPLALMLWWYASRPKKQKAET